MIIKFWGGPRDGAEQVQKITLKEEPIYCSSSDSELYYHYDFIEQIGRYPSRTLKYHRYVLDELEDGKVVYKYDGEV